MTSHQKRLLKLVWPSLAICLSVQLCLGAQFRLSLENWAWRRAAEANFQCPKHKVFIKSHSLHSLFLLPGAWVEDTHKYFFSEHSWHISGLCYIVVSPSLTLRSGRLSIYCCSRCPRTCIQKKIRNPQISL